MNIGVVFPQTEIGDDPGAIREYAQAAEDMGYTHILAYDHVIGASTANRPDWRGPYTSDTSFHEPFVLFSFLAGLTQRIGFVPGVIIMPQRQTVLVAKQAAELDLLSGGRFRMGIGIGWNDVEYEALNENFRNRASRMEEQVAVMRALWTEPVVSFKGRWHSIPEAGIKPLPVQRPIPIWFGGTADAALERAGALGDGWFPQRGPDDTSRAMVDTFRNAAAAAGRDPSTLGIEARLSIGQVPEGDWTRFVEDWQALGATHLCVNTMGAGLKTPQEHIEALRRVKNALGV